MASTLYNIIRRLIFRIVATVSPPFQTYLEDGCNSSRCFKGVYADTFHKLAETMNFTFTIEWVKVFGGIKNGSWTGMIGNILF